MLQSNAGRWLSTRDAADCLQVTPGRIRQLLTAKRFPNAVKAGRDWLIPLSDLDAVKVRKPGRPRKDSQ